MKKVYKVEENGTKTELMQFGTWGNARKFVTRVFGKTEKEIDVTGMNEIYKYDNFKIVVQ